jgi:hypothetical protein
MLLAPTGLCFQGRPSSGGGFIFHAVLIWLLLLLPGVAARASCRLCLSTFGEVNVLTGATFTTMRWRNLVPLGARGNNKLPYTLTLNRDKTVTGAASVTC